MASVVKLSEEFGKAPARMEVQFDPQYFVGYLSLTDEATPMAPASPAGAAPTLFRAVEGSFRKRPRKQTMRSAKEQEEYQDRAFEKRQADLRKLEKEAARVAKQQAVASQNWEKIHKEAADARRERQKAVAQRQAARADMAQTLQATRAINKAVAAKKAPVQAPVLEAEQQGPALLPFLARAAGQRGSNSGGPGKQQAGRQKRVALVKRPTKKGGRAQSSSSSRKRPAAANRPTSAPKFCRCCLTTSAPTWRTGRVQPYTGLQLCNACRIWEGRKGSLSGSLDKVGKRREALLTQEAQGSGAFGGGGAKAEVQAEEQQATKGQVATGQQGSTVQRIGTSDSNSMQSQSAAAATAAAAPAAAAVTAPDAVQQQKCSKHSSSRSRRRQHVQQADIPAGDAGSRATEAGPQAKRKRSAADSNVQQAEPKRAKAGCRGRHGAKFHADEASSGGQGILHVALDSSFANPHQQRAVRVRKTTA